ncbi:MAG: cellulase family glycosylhydrolase, partial [Bacilli bacterium]|nr:cellulase family glycosylhydrolase [Bacilli bacterium]
SQVFLTSTLVHALTNIMGDIDFDGSITIKDVENLEKYLLNLDSIITNENMTIIDLDEDNDITTIDLAILIHLMLEPNQDDVYDELGPTAYEVINSIQIGWNLGNTLDSTNYQKQYLGEIKNIEYYETLWGNPITTKEMIDKIKESGFNSIRIPVTYYDHMTSDGKIDKDWFKRVESVVNYVLDNDLYCILDIHHDTGLYEGGSWIVADAGTFDENAAKLKTLWSQISEYFKDYDYKLIFEGLNETVDSHRQGYDWNTGTEITLNVIKLNQVFVDTVRASGGKNKNRVLAVTTYGGITDEHKLSNFSLPNDIVKDKIILAVHDYVDEESNIDKMITRLKNYIVDKNIPIMIDEFGTKADKTEERRAEIASYYVKRAREIGIPCFWWDDGGNYQLFDRHSLTWKYEKIKDALITSSK